MKYIIFILSFCFISYLSSAQINVLSKANAQTGLGEQKGKFKNAYGLGFQAEYKIKYTPLRIMGGVDYGLNGHKSEPVELIFNNFITHTRVHFTSQVLFLSTGLKYVVNEGNRLSPYAAVSGGAFNYFTNLRIDNPNDIDGCMPLEHKNLLSGWALAGKLESGLRINTNALAASGSINFIEIGAGYLAGTRTKYMRVMNVEGNSEYAGKGEDYTVPFQTGQSNQLHEHSIGKVYKTPTSQLMFHIAIGVKL